jgi:hypothetical protein
MDELYRTSAGGAKRANRPGAPPAIAGAWLGSVRRFTDNNRFAGGARSDLLLGRRRLNCGHPDLTGLDPGNMPR